MSIELKNVTYTYSPGTAYESHALKDVSLVIPDGQFIGIIGHTGSGKSTLVNLLARFYDATARFCITEKMCGLRDMTGNSSAARLVWCSSTRSISCLKMM